MLKHASIDHSDTETQLRRGLERRTYGSTAAGFDSGHVHGMSEGRGQGGAVTPRYRSVWTIKHNSNNKHICVYTTERLRGDVDLQRVFLTGK